jgi:hypothetical protein
MSVTNATKSTVTFDFLVPRNPVIVNLLCNPPAAHRNAGINHFGARMNAGNSDGGNGGLDGLMMGIISTSFQ